ncbi:hypothetical protein BA28_03907, partial [Mycobacterium tuberculosis NRITLD12]
MDGIVDRGVRA